MLNKEQTIYKVTVNNNTVILPIEMKDYYRESVVVTFSTEEIKNAILIFRESDFDTFMDKMRQQEFMSSHVGKRFFRAYMTNSYQTRVSKNGKLNIPSEIFRYIGKIEGLEEICRGTLMEVNCLVLRKIK